LKVTYMVTIDMGYEYAQAWCFYMEYSLNHTHTSLRYFLGYVWRAIKLFSFTAVLCNSPYILNMFKLNSSS